MRLLSLRMYSAGAALALLGLALPAQASTVKAKFTGIDQTVYNLTVQNSNGTYTESGGAGKFYWNGSAYAATNPDAFDGSFYSFCIDIKDNVALNQTYTYNLSPLTSAPILGTGINSDLAMGGMGADKANALSLLFGKHLDEVTDAKSAGAFQLAIWEIVYDDYSSNFTLYDVTNYHPDATDTTHGFKVNSISLSGSNYSSMTTQANGFLHDLVLGGPTLSLAAITSDVYQDQVVVVPLPSAALAGMVLMAGGLSLKKLRRRERLPL